MHVLLSTLVALIVLAFPASAAAVTQELGKTDDVPEASCPEDCQAIGQVGGYQLRQGKGEKVNPYRVPSDGRVTSFTMTLGKPRTAQARFFRRTFGGPPRARISILRRDKKLRHRLVAQSEVFSLQRYLGKTKRFKLSRALAVKRGYIVALTVPTWAPAFAVELPKGVGWRSSRDRRNCRNVRQQAAQERLGSLRTYGCYYRTARLLYTVAFESGESGPDDPDSEDEDPDSEGEDSDPGDSDSDEE